MSQEKILVTIQVNPAQQENPLLVTDAQGGPLVDGDELSLVPETVGVADSQVVVNISGGTKPYSVSLDSGSLPDGDSLVDSSEAQDGSQVSLEGTPTTAGAVEFDLLIQDASGQTARVAARRTLA